MTTTKSEGRKKNKRRQREKKSAEKTDHKQREEGKLTEKKFDQTNERSYPKKEEEYKFCIQTLLERFTVSAARDNNNNTFGKRAFSDLRANDNFLIDSSSIVLPHPKVARYSSHQRAGRREREKRYLRLRENDLTALVDKILFFIVLTLLK